MIVDKVLEIISFKLSKGLEKYIIFNTRKRNQAVNDSEKDFYILIKNVFYRKTVQNVRNRIKIEFNIEDDIEYVVKLTSNGNHYSCKNYHSYTLKTTCGCYG